MADATSSKRSVVFPPQEGVSQSAPAVVIVSTGEADMQACDDQATVISGRPPIALGSLSDSVIRIIHGKVLPGDHLGGYEITQYVGGGGMGRVFRAIDKQLSRSVALKVLSPEHAGDTESLLRFQNEAQSAARLDHENIARVFHVGEDRSLHYIVFEFVEGVNVRSLVERHGPLPLPEALNYALQIADALAHAASRNVVHRDIKPSNVLITPTGQVKLIDMGLARMLRTDAGAGDLTATGVTLGTFDYISPEQARDPRTADVRSDLYSLGCTLFYMLAGRPPFPEGTVLQKLLQHQGDQPPDIRQFRPELPDEAARILRKMLAKDPRHRYGDPTELSKDLAALAVQIGLRPTGVGRAWVVPRTPGIALLRRHLPWIAPVAALVAIVVLLDVIATPLDYVRWWSARVPAASPYDPDGTDNRRLTPETLVQRGADGRSIAETEARASAPKPGAATPPFPSVKAESGKFVAPSPAPGVSEASGAGAPHATPAAEPLLAGSTGSAGPKIVLPSFPSARVQGSGLRSEASAAEWMAAARDAAGLNVIVPIGGRGAGVLSADEQSGGSPAPSPVSDTPARRANVLIVNDHADGQKSFATLDAACSAARSGDVIELHYTGRGSGRLERPISLVNRRITIQAGDGYRPVIAFQPSEPDPVGRSARSMFTLAAGRLVLAGVAIEFHVPREVPAEEWSLFDIQGGQAVQIEKSCLSIVNVSERLAAYHPDVAFFRMRSAPGTEVAAGSAGAGAVARGSIELVDCVIRGEAVLLRTKGLQPGRLSLDNALVALSEPLFVADSGPRPPHPGEIRQVDLRRVTFAGRGGLCRMSSNQVNPHQLAVDVRCAASILMVPQNVPLIEQVGVGDVESQRRRIAWNGARNCYEGVNVFWRIRSANPEGPSESMSSDDWQAFWGPASEDLLAVDQIVWEQLPQADRPMHTHAPADYRQAEISDTDPASEMIDVRTIGFQVEALPDFPAPAVHKPAKSVPLPGATSPKKRAIY